MGDFLAHANSVPNLLTYSRLTYATKCRVRNNENFKSFFKLVKKTKNKEKQKLQRQKEIQKEERKRGRKKKGKKEGGRIKEERGKEEKNNIFQFAQTSKY